MGLFSPWITLHRKTMFNLFIRMISALRTFVDEDC
jgi:hypothetical protein